MDIRRTTRGVMKDVTVGVDGSPKSLAAVEWAADDAARRGAWLNIVHVIDRSPYKFIHSPELERKLAEVTCQIMTRAERTARDRRPGLGMRLEHIEGRPADVLRRLAGESAELVLGSRGMSRTAGGILGSVSAQVAGHSAGPVVIVRDRPRRPMGEIVIGLDDSADCPRPISYAFEHANLHDAEIRALHAWTLPAHTYAPEIDYDLGAVRARQRAVTARQLARHRKSYPALAVYDDLRSGHPVEALVEASTSRPRRGRRARPVRVDGHGIGQPPGAPARPLPHRRRAPVRPPLKQVSI